MSAWRKKDIAANTPDWAVKSTIVNAASNKAAASAPTAANVAILYANTTANAYTSRETIGLFAIDAAEQANSQNRGVTHTGWVLKTTGQGGRANRIQYETLVTLSTVTGDGDATTIANTANP